MPSNALSSGSLSTKAPKICKPAPWPPALPPPPIEQAKFYVFASIDDRTALGPINFAAACFCTYQAGPNYWTGYSSKDPNIPHFGIVLTIHDDRDTWDGRIWYWWPPGPGWSWEFFEVPLHPGRPYLSELAEEETYVPPGILVRTADCVCREVPP